GNPRQPSLSFPVVIGEGSHPFTFRTRKLSPLPPMVLRGKLRGRVGHCREYSQKPASMRRAFLFLIPELGSSPEPRTPSAPSSLARRGFARPPLGNRHGIAGPSHQLGPALQDL